MFKPQTPRGSRHDDELILLGLVFFTGLVPAAIALMHGGPWSAAPTCGLLFCALSGLGLLAKARSAVRRRRGDEDAGSED